MAEIRGAWRRADVCGVDSIWVWDHFFPLYGDPDAASFEAYTMLAAMAVETTSARIGALVACNAYRNPDLLADMSRTIDHLSDGRFTLGIGSGWFERDFVEYGYELGSAASRLRDLAVALPRIRNRLGALNPGPVGSSLPILVGGGGATVTLRLVAEHADAWNVTGPVDHFREKNLILDEWCERVGRDPRAIERTVGIDAVEIGDWAAYVDAGAEHLIVRLTAPFDLAPVERLLDDVRGMR